MKYLITTLIALIVSGSAMAQESTPPKTKAAKWKKIWSEEFNSRALNARNWDTIPRGTADWNRYMSTQKDLIKIKNGNLILIGCPTPDGSTDTSKYVTGGVYSRGKFNFQYGRIDIRAKLESAQGAWPALWLLPDVEGRKWPDQGEIDIMEHLNYDHLVYQTAHSNYTVTHGIKDNPQHGGKARILRDTYNIYSVEWTPTRIVWMVDGIPTFEYNKLNTPEAQAKGQWPFDEVFYIILSQQLGGAGTWVGEIDNDDLPVEMLIDYIRVYQLR